MNAASRSREFSGTDDEPIVAGLVRLALEVGFEQLHRLAHQLRVLRDDAEAAALLHVEAR